MCRNGRYTERGIKEIDGFMAERWRTEPEFASSRTCEPVEPLEPVEPRNPLNPLNPLNLFNLLNP
jgi:hypothetical protein